TPHLHPRSSRENAQKAGYRSGDGQTRADGFSPHPEYLSSRRKRSRGEHAHRLPAKGKNPYRSRRIQPAAAQCPRWTSHQGKSGSLRQHSAAEARRTTDCADPRTPGDDRRFAEGHREALIPNATTKTRKHEEDHFLFRVFV